MKFVLLQTAIYRLSAYHAFHDFAERPEGITTDDIEAVASYRANLAGYRKRRRLYKRAKAGGGVSAPTTQNWLLSVEPREPDCPAIVLHFLNMLVIRGKSINASETAILKHITNVRFPSYVLDENGLATRLEPWNFEDNRHSAYAPFRVRNRGLGTEIPVYVLKADLEHFVEHGRLNSEERATTVEEGETGPTPFETIAERPETPTNGINEGKAAELPDPATENRGGDDNAAAPQETALASQENDERPDYIPPYVAFMLRAAREMGLEPGTRILKETIKDWLRENWPNQLGDSTERKIEQMATFLRCPEDELGGYFHPNRDEKGVTL